MAKIQSITKCIVLVSIAFHAILSTEGRLLKIMNKKETSSAKTSSTEKIFPPIGYGDSGTAYKDDIRPTTPGNRLGVSHSFAQEKEDVESKVVVVDHRVSPAGAGHSVSVTGYKDGFRPTAPGHSPGIGHALKSKNAEPKA